MPWTQNQIDAIESTGGSVLVSAAAGSGKTSVLSERVIRMITRAIDPVPADKLLIVTFTRDAAAEMKQRINDELNALLESGDYGEELVRQKQRFYNSTVSTIDSFCGSLVREYFHFLGVSNDYRIVDESELALIRQKALDNTFASFYAHGDESFKRLVRAFLYKSGDSKLRSCVLKISGFLECVPFPDNWLDDALSDYELSSLSDAKWGRVILNDALDNVSYLIRLVLRSLKLCKADEELEKRYREPYTEGLSRLIELRRMIKNSRWDDSAKLLGSITCFKGLSRMPSNKGMAGRIEFGGIKSQLPEALEELKETFYYSEEEIISQAEILKPLIGELFKLVRAYERELWELKLRKNVLHFSDTSHLAVKLLAEYDPTAGFVKTPLANEISRRYDAVIVDEYQDINEVQDLIFNCVSNGENLFVVGDVKQSIYTFRQTRPKLFTNRRDRYYRYDRDDPRYPATIFLDKNFRSRGEVCDTVNFIFRLLMSRKTADIDYTADDYLVVGAEYPESGFCGTEIALLDCDRIAHSIVGDREDAKSKKKYKLDASTGESKATVEARFIAKRIRELMSCGYLVTEKNGAQRQPRYSDFAVIMRSPGGGGKFKSKDGGKKGAAEIVRVLRDLGIPAYCEQSDSLFENREIKLLLNLLRIIDNPINDIPLLSVMLSPVFGFTPDELALIRANDRYSSLYFSLKSYEDKSEKVRGFLEQLRELREFAASSTVDELLGKIYEFSALGAITAAVNGGASPTANLDLMRVYARSYSANGYKSLSDFIGFIDRLISQRESPGSAQGSDSGAQNRVRVLSIHKSKGLEFPVCFLADAAHAFNEDDFKGSMLIDSESGIGIRHVKGLIDSDSVARRAIIIKKRHEQTADELRLLYVALTRAREKLIITSTVDSAGSWLEAALNTSSKRKADPYLISKSRCMLKWILMTAAANPYCAAQMRGEEPREDEGSLKWKFTLIENYAQLFFHSESEEKKEASHTSEEKNYAELLRANLRFKYKNEAVLGLPQKVSASEIAHRQNEVFESVIAVPKFIERRELSATERGTAHHEFLRYCDFSAARSDVSSEIERLLKKGRLTQKQVDSIDAEKLSAILSNPLFDRLVKADRVYREEQFTVEIPPSLIDEAYSGVDEKAGCIMQGAVDLAFTENGRLFIVDYKTDYVKSADELAERYRKQLELYREAMRQTMKQDAEGLYIFSLHLNELIPV